MINSLFPAKLLPVMLSLGGIDPYKQVNAVSKAERQHFEELITHFPFTVTGTRGFREAIITQGGVSVKEIRPGTMEAKKKEGLYFVGEVLDLDALTGGFNLQIAWQVPTLQPKRSGQRKNRNKIWITDFRIFRRKREDEI